LNGAKAFRYEISKASQASLLKSLNLRFIPTRIIHDAGQAVAATAGLRYPIVVKPSIGGSGKGVTRFDSSRELEESVAGGRLDLGYDHIGLVQEFVPARGGYITRVETLGGNYLYAIRVDGYAPPPQIIHDIERIVQAAGIDVGGIEYLVDDRDGQAYYYDINALSNFVADAPRVIGFDPVKNLADFLEKELSDAA
jgi:D-alanine-D-alanine ligase-like ATP-grasp enzyme